ncbi:ThuA domain-containing protein [Paenibacillus sp. CGMCC 1.16610]|uniref:ThuA domain-containing protein n=1 Tax=Paenibacillus anseongense TaxID=2682845 RepID=A0ABW9UB63_9BACL|nr:MULTISPECIES: ThuA domain-containing protein [Paenibacillus]MBA2938256.1 ThuA domain-containing protein [Paenibacillus sp. CGMCC 1.16610]MVQ37314.1 ThuA domain-containing protein [Paenibacillus anseongense]
MSEIKVMLIGDNTDAPWHPLEPTRQQLAAILGDEFALTATEDYQVLSELDHNQFPLCISYTDCWKRDLSQQQTAGLLRYVAGGGSLLVIHNGISLQRSYELLQMIGAKFTGHPPYQPLVYYRSAAEHPLLEGVENFNLDEEPYLFEFDPFTKKTVFMEFEFEGKRYPAAWEHVYGLGKVVYLQPGHHAPSFQPEAYRRLVLNSARWLSRQV